MAEPTLDLESFRGSLRAPGPPGAANMALRALWFDAKGRPESAHRAAHFEESPSCQRVRAYLLRKKGRNREARMAYWRAGVRPWEGDDASEWLDIVQTLLAEFPVASAYGA